MARSLIAVLLKRSFGLLVIVPFIITGLATTCVALPLMCLYSLTVLSVPLKANDHHYAGSRVPSAPPLPLSEPGSGTAVIASVTERPQQVIQLTGSEPRLPNLPPLPQRQLPDTASEDLGTVSYGQGIQFIRLDAPTLAPMAFTRFCLSYPGDCKSEDVLSGGDRVELDRVRRSELESINHAVNASIYPQRNEEGRAGEKWLLSPARGDCNDYAVTKRHELIARGWPTRNVLLSEVVIASGEHHLVTVVRTDSGDLVLDNLTDQIMPWSRTPYRWLRMQMPRNPNYWAAISEQGTQRAMARREML